MDTRHALGSWRIFTTLGQEEKNVDGCDGNTPNLDRHRARRCGSPGVFERSIRHPRGHIRHTVGPRTSHDLPSHPPGVLKRYRSC